VLIICIPALARSSSSGDAFAATESNGDADERKLMTLHMGGRPLSFGGEDFSPHFSS
jgi:hypothetical protein